MHGHEKSDPAVVAVKPANNTGRPGAERVERRAGAEGNAERQSTRRAQNREGVSQMPNRARPAWPSSPEVGAVCGKAARTDLCGGRPAMGVPTAIGPSPTMTGVAKQESQPFRLLVLLGSQ
jgi:hypothetical protein